MTYTRGLDLSGSISGAGGIGGLLARSHHTAQATNHFFYHADGNGNVTAIISSNQAVVAEYQYDPFGNLQSMRGALAEGNLYRFSSKEYHPNSGLYYYGYRFYDPNLQRWLNRDPVGEAGGINLYGFVGNNPIALIDVLGLRTVTISMYFSGDIKLDQCVKDEVNRILHNCMKTCCNKNNKVGLNWLPFSGDPSKVALGCSGGTCGFNPTGYSVAVVGTEASGRWAGRTGGGIFFPGNTVTINLTALPEIVENADTSYCKGLALTIAHEAFLHAIGGKWGHYYSKGYVDANKGKPGGELSKKTCKELCDELDVD